MHSQKINKVISRTVFKHSKSTLEFVVLQEKTMIQRIQSLFMLIALIATILVFFFPLAGFLSDFSYYKLYIYQVKPLVPDAEKLFPSMFTLPLLLLNTFAGLAVGVALFAYKNRLRQIQILRFAFLLEIVEIGLIFFFYAPSVQRKTGITPDYTGEWGIYLPLLALLCIYLANRFVMKDEKKVRAADRLR